MRYYIHYLIVTESDKPRSEASVNSFHQMQSLGFSVIIPQNDSEPFIAIHPDKLIEQGVPTE